ncbi:MAG TPA: AAA family ATPase [Candidatus Dormibacteraeota bacterium]|nr:AAA family ATPase [Candidatus Dormibacteraeota bacterium]
MLWPQVDESEGRVNLRTALNYLRQALGESADSILVASRDLVAVAPGSLDLDVDAMREAERLVHRDLEPRLGHQLEAAVRCYRAPFLAGLFLPDAPEFETWIEAQRTHWRNVVAELLSRLATIYVQSGELEQAFAALQQWTRTNPDEELAWQRLIELNLMRGDWIGARHAWDRYRCSLLELDAVPSELMSRLYERIAGQAAMVGMTESAGIADLDFRQTPFVGRAREWAQLTRAYQRAESGRCEVVLIEGVAGVGKSRLASEFMASITGRGADLIAGRGFEGIDHLPYGALIEGLRPRLEAENAPEDLLSDLWLTELARVLPELRERYPDLGISPEDTLTRSRVFEAVARLGLALARRKPLAILVDDAQWADTDTRDLLRYAMRRWIETDSRVLLVILCRRPVAPQTGLEEWLCALEAETAMLRLKLDPLPAADVTHLVALLAGTEDGSNQTVESFGRWLADQTGGQPRPVVQTLRGLFEGGLLRIRALNDSRWVIEPPDETLIPQLSFAGARI